MEKEKSIDTQNEISYIEEVKEDSIGNISTDSDQIMEPLEISLKPLDSKSNINNFLETCPICLVEFDERESRDCSECKRRMHSLCIENITKCDVCQVFIILE